MRDKQDGKPMATAASRVFHHLFNAREARTKQELSRELGLSLPTIYQAIDQLEKQGLIAPTEERSSTGGRRATAFSINPSSAVAIGASCTGTQIRLIAVNLLGTTALRAEAPCPPGTLRTLRDTLRHEIEEFSLSPELASREILGVGIALPAIVDPTARTVSHAGVLELGDFAIDDLIAGLPYPTLVDNDANCGGFSEWSPGRTSENLVYLSLEQGVGGAILINGDPFAGMHGRSGEFGHICVETGGRACACGKRGCLEAYCSAARLSTDMGCDLGTFFSRLAAGGDAERERWEEFAEHLTRGIAAIHMALDTDIVIGGLLAQYLPAHLGDICRRVQALDPFSGGGPYVRIARHPHRGVPLGAALKVVARFIASV